MSDKQLSNMSVELDEETLFLVTQTFKALSDPTRLRIVSRRAFR